MMKLQFRLRDFVYTALIVLFGAFLSFQFFAQQSPAYAEDGTPIRAATDIFFVTIYDRGSSRTIKTATATVAEVLERSGVELAETDIVEPSLNAIIDDDYNINIYRARPAIIIDGSEKRYLMTASYDPKQIAIEAGITVYDGDTFTTEFNTNFLEAGVASTYRIEHNGGSTITIEETLPYGTEKRYDPNLAKGESYVEQAGEDGRRISVYQVNFENNIEVSRDLISEEVQFEPIPEIIVIGSRVTIPPEREQCAAWAREAGVAEQDLESALDLIYRESGCRVDATNSSSGAYGIPQSLPGNKMSALGDDWETNPVTQIRWMIGYVNQRYGGWQQALDYWWCTGVCTSRMGTITKNGHWY